MISEPKESYAINPIFNSNIIIKENLYSCCDLSQEELSYDRGYNNDLAHVTDISHYHHNDLRVKVEILVGLSKTLQNSDVIGSSNDSFLETRYSQNMGYKSRSWFLMASSTEIL